MNIQQLNDFIINRSRKYSLNDSVEIDPNYVCENTGLNVNQLTYKLIVIAAQEYNQNINLMNKYESLLNEYETEKEKNKLLESALNDKISQKIYQQKLNELNQNNKDKGRAKMSVNDYLFYRNCGWSDKEIETKLGVSRSTVWRLKKKAEELGMTTK